MQKKDFKLKKTEAFNTDFLMKELQNQWLSALHTH